MESNASPNQAADPPASRSSYGVDQPIGAPSSAAKTAPVTAVSHPTEPQRVQVQEAVRRVNVNDMRVAAVGPTLTYSQRAALVNPGDAQMRVTMQA